MSLRDRISPRFARLEPSTMMRMFKAAAGRKDLIDLSLGEPDVATDPGIVEAARRAGLDGDTHYVQSAGYGSLREAIARRWAEKYGLRLGADRVLVGTGGSHICWLAFQALLEPGDEVILLEPYFTFYAQQVRYNRGVPVAVRCAEERGFIPDPEDLARAVTPRTKAIVVNSPCNPSGSVFGRDTLEGVARIAEEHDLAVISDELYESFVYEGEHIPFAALPGMAERTLTVGGFSKSFAMCGWRIGYALGPEELIRPMDLLAIVQTLSVNGMVQRAAEHALAEAGDFERSLVELYRGRTAFAAEAAGRLPGVRAERPKGAFYLFADVSGTGMDGETFALRMLDEAGVVSVPGVAFGEDCGRYVRFACTVPNERMREACGRMAAVLGG
jgi:aspartate/methionine/tyrosine aminotransferase